MKRCRWIIKALTFACVLVGAGMSLAPIAHAAYATTGLLVSGDLVAGESGFPILGSFTYTASALPAGTGLRVSFSRDASNWYNSAGTALGWDTLTQGTHVIDLSGLAWNLYHFYYKIEFTSDGSGTPVLDDISVSFSGPSVYQTYYGNGTLLSTNLLNGETVAGITSFSYNASALPAGTGLSVRFSQNGSTWYSSAGVADGWDTLAAGVHTIDLTGLAWTGANFYYQMQFTSDGTATPVLDDVNVSFTMPDITPPTISSITSSTGNGSYKAGSAINVSLTFSEAVTTTGTITVTLDSGGTCTFSGITNSTTASCTYTVGAGENSADLTVSDVAGTIKDQATNPMTNFVPTTNLAANKDIVIDTTAPANPSATPAGGTFNATQSVTLASAGSSAIYYTVNGDTPTTSSTLYTGAISVSTTTTLKALAVDTATNQSGVMTEVFTIDTGAPTISSITSSTGNGSYKAGSAINVSLTFSEAVTTTGTITVTLDSGGTCTFSGITNSTTASCTYTVGAGENSADLTVSDVAGTIKDQATNPMTNFVPTTNLAANKDIVIDTTAPANPSATPAGGTFNATQSVTLASAGSSAIYYTVNGDTPTTSSTLYTGAISVSTTTTLKALAVDTATNQSGVMTESYVIDATLPSTPVATPEAGTYNATQSVTLSADGSDYIKYSITESPATCAAGTLYESPISVSSSQTIYVRACDNAGNSSTASFAYTIDATPPATPPVTITPTGGGRRGGVRPADWSNLPLAPTGGYKILINNGARTTANSIVNLSFNAGSDIKRMAISLTGDFTDSIQENLQSTKQLDLCSKFGGLTKTPTCSDGQYIVYAKFYTQYGRSSDVVSQKINLVTTSQLSQQKPKETDTSVPQKLPSGTSAVFVNYLRFGTASEEVRRLQSLLATKPGIYPEGKITGYYGSLTKKAVQRFQLEYKVINSIFDAGSGIVGPKTRAKLQEVFGE